MKLKPTNKYKKKKNENFVLANDTKKCNEDQGP